MAGFLGWWGSDVAHTSDVPASDMFVTALLVSPFIAAWLWRRLK